MSDIKEAFLNVVIRDEGRDVFYSTTTNFRENQALSLYIFSALCLVLLAHRFC